MIFCVPFNLQLFSIKMMEGIVETSYAPRDKFYIDRAKLLPFSRFLTQPKYVRQGGVAIANDGGWSGGRSGLVRLQREGTMYFV